MAQNGVAESGQEPTKNIFAKKLTRHKDQAHKSSHIMKSDTRLKINLELDRNATNEDWMVIEVEDDDR